MRVDREVDYHGFTRAEMRADLNRVWASRAWDGLSRVRIVHGTGDALWRELDRWCHEKGITYTREPHGGATVIYPGRRNLPQVVPPHRPLAHLPRPKARPRPAPPPAPPSPADHALFEEEMTRLEGGDRPSMMRRKRPHHE